MPKFKYLRPFQRISTKFQAEESYYIYRYISQFRYDYTIAGTAHTDLEEFLCASLVWPTKGNPCEGISNRWYGEQDNSTYNVILRGVRATIVAVDKK